MTSNDGMDRRLTAWLDERAAPSAPEGLNEVTTEHVMATRQRPSWATTERWISMETRARFGIIPRAVIVLATLALLTALAAGAIAVGSSSGPSLPAPFGLASNGLIAYAADGDIFIVEPDGSDTRAVTSGPDVEESPKWSRDGTRLAYWSGPEDGPKDLVVIDPDGGDPIVIAQSAGVDAGSILWSADGSEIMVSMEVPGVGASPCSVPEGSGGACGSRLFLANTDGSGMRPVGDPDLDARGPELSSDRVTVAFGGGAAASESLYLMDWDGSSVRRLEGVEPGGGWAFAKQAWHPDGTHIITHDNGSLQEIWQVEADGSDAIIISSGGNVWPNYSPDGERISTGKGFGMSLWTPGGQPVSVSIEAIEWSPDGQRIAARRRGPVVVVVGRDGNDLVEIGTGEGGEPSWQRIVS